MASEPLLSTPKSPASGLSLPLAAKIKMKARKWQHVSHDHALDMSMAMKSPNVAKAGAKAQAKQAGSESTEEEISLQSNGEAITNLLNNCLGSGVLAVPLVMKNLGIPACLGMLIISGVLNRFTLELILKCCDVAAMETSYNRVGRLALGNAGRYIVVFAFVTMGFGCLVSYLDATVDAVGGLAETAGTKLSTTTLSLIACCMLFPPTYIRSLKSVATLSFIAFIGALVVVACVVMRCGTDLVMQGLPSADEVRWAPESFSIFLSSVPTTLTVFSIQAGGSIVLSSMQDKSPANCAKVTLSAYLIVFFINFSVSVPTYLRFLDKTQGDLLNSFDPTDPITIIAKVAVLDLVVLSYMFMMIPCRVALIEILFKKNEALMEASYAQFLGVTTTVNLLALFAASLVSDLSMVIGLVGAVAANLVGFILPCLIYVVVRSDPKDGSTPVPKASFKNAPYFLLAFLSLCCMISGVYTILG